MANEDNPYSGIISPGQAQSQVDAATLDSASLSIDGTFAGDSDLLIPTQKASKLYIDNENDSQDSSITTNADNIADNVTDIATNAADITNLETTVGVYRNAIINGSMQVAQLGAGPFTPDDLEYTLDQCQNISDGNGVVTHTQVDEGSGEFSLKMIVQTINKKFGYFQPIENIDSEKLQGQYVSLRFEAKTTTAKLINNIRAAILSFTGTADSTGDPVSAWNASGNDPTWAANYTAENTPANLALTTAYQTFTIENVYLDTASINNICLAIWADDDDGASGDELFIKNIQINVGTKALPFKRLRFQTELIRCQWFLNKLGGSNFNGLGSGGCSATNKAFSVVQFPEMRVAPSPTFSNIAVWTAGSGTLTLSSAIFTGVGTNGALIDGTVAGTPFLVGATSMMWSNAGGYLLLDSRI